MSERIPSHDQAAVGVGPVATSPEEVLGHALAAYRSALNPGDPGGERIVGLGYAAGRLLELTGHPGRALTHHLDALAEPGATEGPGTTRLLQAVVRTAEQAVAWQDAARGIERVRSVLTPGPAAALAVWHGHLLRRGGQHEEADVLLARAEPLLDGPLLRFTARMERLQALVELGRTGPAEALCREALALLPEREADLRASLSGLLRLQGRGEEAVVEAERSLALQPDSEEARLVRALALQQLGRGGEAEDSR